MWQFSAFRSLHICIEAYIRAYVSRGRSERDLAPDSGVYLENGALFDSISSVVSRRLASAIFSEHGEGRSRESEQELRGELFREFRKGGELCV